MVLTEVIDTTTKWAFQGAPSTGRADIEFATTRPVQYFILRDNSGGGVNNSMFLWNNHADSNAGWVGFSGDRSFRIHSNQNNLRLSASNGGDYSPSIVVKPNTGSGSQKLVGIGNF